MRIKESAQLHRDFDGSQARHARLLEHFENFQRGAKLLAQAGYPIRRIEFTNERDTSFDVTLFERTIRFRFVFDRSPDGGGGSGIVVVEDVSDRRPNKDPIPVWRIKFNGDGRTDLELGEHEDPITITSADSAKRIVLAAMDEVISKPPA